MRLIAASILLVISYVSSQNTPVTLCGRQLADARELLCYGAEYVNKRGYSAHYSLDKPADDSREEDWTWAVWGGRHGAGGALSSRYKRQGLASECCNKPCTPEVILSYC